MEFNKEQLLEALAKIAPNRYLQAVLIFALFVLVAKIVDMFMTRFIRRLLKKTKFTLDDQILDIFHRPIFVSIVLFGLAVATDRLDFSHTVHYVTLSGLKTVAIFLWAKAVARFLQLIIELVSRDDSRYTLIQHRTLPLFSNLLVILVVALALYFVFLAWNIDVTAWIASAGILGLAISFAAKDTLANLFSGVFIFNGCTLQAWRFHRAGFGRAGGGDAHRHTQHTVVDPRRCRDHRAQFHHGQRQDHQ